MTATITFGKDGTFVRLFPENETEKKILSVFGEALTFTGYVEHEAQSAFDRTDPVVKCAVISARKEVPTPQAGTEQI